MCSGYGGDMEEDSFILLAVRGAVVWPWQERGYLHTGQEDKCGRQNNNLVGRSLKQQMKSDDGKNVRDK